MSVQPQVYVHIDSDSFAVERIQYQEADVDGVEQPKQNAPNYNISGEGDIDNLYDHGSDIFIQAVNAVVEDKSNLTYYIDGDSDKSVNLETILNDFALACGFRQFLQHDPVYCDAQLRENEFEIEASLKETTNVTYVKYVEDADKLESFDNLYESDNRYDVQSLVEKIGLSVNQSNSYVKFAHANPNPIDLVLQTYCVKYYYDTRDSADTKPYKARVVLLPQAVYIIPEMEACIPIVPKK